MSQDVNSDSKNHMLDVTFINPFVYAAKSVLETMANIELTMQKPTLASSQDPSGDIAGVLDMRDAQIQGQFIVSFPEETILVVVENLLGEKYTDLCDEVIDAVGEIANMIVGGAKAAMPGNYNFEMATPVMFVKENYQDIELVSPTQITIPLETSAGMFYIEVGFDNTESEEEEAEG